MIMVKKLSRKQKLAKVDWKNVLGNPLRVVLYPVLGYLVTLPADRFVVDLSAQQYTLTIIVLSALQSLLYNGAKAYKRV